MFGYYDPESIHVDNGIHVMNFISARDIDDVTRVAIDSREKAGEVITALREQKTHFISWLGGGVEKASGSLRINDSQPDEGIMETRDGRRIPVKMEFTPGKNQLPRHSLCVATGVNRDGALRVARLIASPVGPDITPAEPNPGTDKKMD